jgi:nucleoside-specific outer membrane channel protein Tsx
MKKTLLTIAGAALLSTSVQAEQYWSDTSISLLYGDSYEAPFGTEDQTFTTMTLEHVSGHSWGGLFYFLDRSVGDVTESYSEVSPKFNLVKMDGVVTAITASITYESGSSAFSNFDNYLYGVGFDLAIPGMNYASATVYRAFNEGDDDNQITLTYGVSSGGFNLDGYVDYSFDNDSGEDQMMINPQITYDIAPMLGASGKVKVGIEYFYWGNKYGVDGADQNAVSLLLKVHL